MDHEWDSDGRLCLVSSNNLREFSEAEEEKEQAGRR
jgi:hypothetical protein